MKITFEEYEGCFSIDLEAETKEDVIKLGRFGIGKLKELRSANVHFGSEPSCTACIVIGKSKSNASTL